MQQSSRKKQRHDSYSKSFALSDVPEYALSDTEAKASELSHGSSRDGVSLFGGTKRKKHNGFFASFCADHTFSHPSFVPSNDSLRFPTEVRASSLCHAHKTSVRTHGVADGNAEATLAESMQSMRAAVAQYNHARGSLHDLASAADACALVFEKACLDADACHFEKNNTHTAPCNPGWLSGTSTTTDAECFSPS